MQLGNDAHHCKQGKRIKIQPNYDKRDLHTTHSTLLQCVTGDHTILHYYCFMICIHTYIDTHKCFFYENKHIYILIIIRFQKKILKIILWTLYNINLINELFLKVILRQF